MLPKVPSRVKMETDGASCKGHLEGSQALTFITSGLNNLYAIPKGNFRPSLQECSAATSRQCSAEVASLILSIRRFISLFQFKLIYSFSIWRHFIYPTRGHSCLRLTHPRGAMACHHCVRGAKWGSVSCLTF